MHFSTTERFFIEAFFFVLMCLSTYLTYWYLSMPLTVLAIFQLRKYLKKRKKKASLS